MSESCVFGEAIERIKYTGEKMLYRNMLKIFFLIPLLLVSISCNSTSKAQNEKAPNSRNEVESKSTVLIPINKGQGYSWHRHYKEFRQFRGTRNILNNMISSQNDHEKYVSVIEEVQELTNSAVGWAVVQKLSPPYEGEPIIHLMVEGVDGWSLIVFGDERTNAKIKMPDMSLKLLENLNSSCPLDETRVSPHRGTISISYRRSSRTEVQHLSCCNHKEHPFCSI